MKTINISKVVCSVLLSSTCALSLCATTLQEAVNDALVQNPELKALVKHSEAWKTYIDEEKGGYKPVIDLAVTGESKKVYKQTEGDSKGEGHQAGFNAQLKLEQMLYNGGLTAAKVEEAKFRDKVNRYTNAAKAEGVILDGVKAYLDLVKYDMRLGLSKVNLATHEEYLNTAKSNEELSGSALDTYEVQAKLHMAKKNYIDEVDNNQIAQNSFKRLTGSEAEAPVCLPTIDRSLLPAKLEDLVDMAVSQNNNVLAQMSKINEQRAIINQEESKHLPTLKYILSGTWDDDLMEADTRTDIYSARIVLNYNLYNGGKDTISEARENIFLLESQKVLDSKTDLVVDEISSAFTSFDNITNKINELEGYVATNEEILKIYQDQFEGGTRTFVDVLDIESDLYNAKTQLIDERVKLIDTYYWMLSLTSKLQETITNGPDQPCAELKEEAKKVEPKKDELKELEELMEPAPVVGKMTVEEVPPAPVEKVDSAVRYESLRKALLAEFKDELASGRMLFNTETISLRFTDSSTAMPLDAKGNPVMSDGYKATLNDFVPRFVKILKSYDDAFSQINVDGFSKINYANSEQEGDFMANLKASKQRANAVLSYIKSIDDNIVASNKGVLKMFKPFGRSYSNPVLNADGSENLEMSNRVEFIIKGK